MRASAYAVTAAKAVQSAIGPMPADPGLLLIEHLNLNVMSTDVALQFYTALGCVRDERRSMKKTLHSNCGALTQFHTPSPENEAFIAGSGAQRWRGVVELLYKDGAQRQAAVDRIEALKGSQVFQETLLNIEHGLDGDINVTGPYGNAFILRTTSLSRETALGETSGQRPGSESSTCIGMGSVSLQVPPGTAARGARFYSEVLGFNTKEISPECWAIMGGPNGDSQQLILEETAGSTGKEIGEHIAIYIGDFTGCFDRLQSRGLIFVNPRFEHLDKSTTVDEALHYNCFRFKDITDLESGEKLFELEHEVRSTCHKSCPLKV